MLLNISKKRRISSIFRFILTHPDMDHMDGIKNLFDNFDVYNFWDTENNKVLNDFSNSEYKDYDWEFYQSIRKEDKNPKVLKIYADEIGEYYNKDIKNNNNGDGLYILSPTKDMVNQANQNEKYNDCSYVLLFITNGHKIIFSGDSEEKTWNYIITKHKDEISSIDVLIAPHHGRKSGGNDCYLDILEPKLTLFGYAPSEDLDYSSWNNRKLDYITNNEAGCIILDVDLFNGIYVYITNRKYAEKYNSDTHYNENLNAWYIDCIK